MLMALCIAMVSGCSIYDKVTNRWTFDRGEVAGAIAEKDAGDLYEFMSPYMLEENDLTEEDLQDRPGKTPHKVHQLVEVIGLFFAHLLHISEDEL